MCWLFFIYPLVSLATLQAFDCRPRGLNLLAVDFREECPQPGSFYVVWSAAFVIIYPLGIPFFYLVSMVFMGVPFLAADLYEMGTLKALSFARLKSKPVQLLREMAQKLSSLKINSVGHEELSECQMLIDKIDAESFDENRMFRFETTSSYYLFVQTFLIYFDVDPFLPIEKVKFNGFLFKLINDSSLLASTSGSTVSYQEAIQLLVFQWDPVLQDKLRDAENEFKASATTNGEMKREKLKEFHNHMKAQRSRRSMYEALSRQKDGRFILSQKIFELCENIVANLKLPPTHITWSSVSINPVHQVMEESDSKDIELLQSLFVIHPDLPDHRVRKGLFGKLFNFASMLSSSEPQDLQSVNKRKKLAVDAIRRFGFLFVSYKVEFWYWDLIELSRK